MLIDTVKVNNDYTLEVILNNHYKITYDMKTRLDNIRFSQLRDFEIFRNVSFNNNVIRWSDNCELTINEILYDIEK